MTAFEMRPPCTAPGRRCACLKERVLVICAGARSPRTTAETLRGLALGAIDIYAVLFAMEFEGLIACRRTAPWTWVPTARGEDFLRCRGGAARRAAVTATLCNGAPVPSTKPPRESRLHASQSSSQAPSDLSTNDA